MLKPVTAAARATRLADMGVVRAQGADAVKFLQGQVSNDVARLAADRSVLAGLHNAQGRAIAVLRMVLVEPDEILMLVPRELASGVAARLSKFVLRAKVKISDVSVEWEVAGVELGGVAEGLPAASVGAARRDEDGRAWVCMATGGDRDGVPGGPTPASRWLVASKATPSDEPRGDEGNAALHIGRFVPSSMTRDEWRAADIAASLPQVFAATSEAFVAQMLNLDVLDGIAFDKGCYTGQEVIARAHYRGKVKRRMQRFRSHAPVKLNPGDSGTLPDGRSFKVVDAVQLDDGTTEFLAVAPMTASGADDESPSAQTATATTTAAPAIAAPLEAEQLPLPYALPA
jgi:folate-binding protein YgfZ